MTLDPYAPPKTELHDGIDLPRPPRPSAVTIAVALLWSSLVLDFPTAYLSAVEDSSVELDGLYLSVMAIVLAIWAFIIVCINDGRNWARITMLVMLVLSLIGLLIPVEYYMSPMLRSLEIIGVGLEVVAMVLLFRMPGSLWFNWRQVKLTTYG